MTRRDKELALKLRKTGKSYKEIMAEMKVSKSTLSDWLRPFGWSKGIRERLTEISKKTSKIRIERLDKIRGKRLAMVYETARNEAEKEFQEYKYHPLFIAGVSIYWGEGDKMTKQIVRMSNTDPKMISLFVTFLKDFCGVERDRIRAWLLLYPDLDEETCKKFWGKEAFLQGIFFNKSIVIKGKHKTRRLGYGVCNISVSSRFFKEKMLVWLRLLPEEMTRREYYASIV